MSASKYGSTDGQASTSSANQLSVPEPYQPRKNSRYEESKKIARKYKDYEEFLSTQNLLESGESSSVIDEAIPTDLREVGRNLRSHKKLDDNVYEAVKQTLPEDINANNVEEDSDEAPEEESLLTGKENVIAKLEAERAALRDIERQKKEKRKQIEERNRQQAEQRRKRAEKPEETPKFLPQDLLQNYDAEEELEKPKKTVFNDEEPATTRKEILAVKLKEARGMSKKVMRKGPVRVQVLNKNRGLLSVPTNNIKSKKDKWLNRKVLKRK
ncbi:uncharacterized protein OGAPODRAFT_11538 [Ogataea polymorpha]|uniref:uncharacterized protein n=1 Tax=Ogataea polymorpha TaxID=460523 RepID=UPI0007F3837E|nr:uncharacterized protein OGAPODRAFT_11538 [Ogataea polymorpha]OBA17158.1 hypothetical protein OGAPODRAFT_11538 [Ogataea polymorpha]